MCVWSSFLRLAYALGSLARMSGDDPRVRGRWLKANVLPLLDLTETTRPCFAFRLSLWHLLHVSMLFRDEMYCNLFLLKNNVYFLSHKTT